MTNRRGNAIDDDPQWSPDGRKLLFTRHARSAKSQVYVINPDGSGLRNLSRKPGAVDLAPAWRPG